MAGNSKTGKAELIAIYRLEFYKKQKNWKLSDTKRAAPRQKPNTKQTKHNLNQTYEVGDLGTAEPVHIEPLNDAFLETQSDKNQSPTKEDALSSWVLTQSLDKADLPYPPQEIQTEPDLVWPEPEHLCEEQVWRRSAEQIDIKIPMSGRDYNRFAAAVWTDDAVWDPRDQEYAPDVWAAGIPSERAYTPEDLVYTAEHYLSEPYSQFSGQQWAAGEHTPWTGVVDWCADRDYLDEVWSVDSMSEFMRGADAAPHSSELDLRPISSPFDAELSTTTLACLSSRQLRASVHAHAEALKKLLHEAEVRAPLADKLSRSSQDPPAHPHSYDEFPTRDVEPATPLRRESTFTKQTDLFLAGSYRLCNDIEVGRGRGRLKDRVIGIGRGRPYRL